MKTQARRRPPARPAITIALPTESHQNPEIGVGDAGHEPGKVRVCRAGGVTAGKTRERYGPAARYSENPEDDERKAANNPDRSRVLQGLPWQARQRSQAG